MSLLFLQGDDERRAKTGDGKVRYIFSVIRYKKSKMLVTDSPWVHNMLFFWFQFIIGGLEGEQLYRGGLKGRGFNGCTSITY
jgi:hypothetical protein